MQSNMWLHIGDQYAKMFSEVKFIMKFKDFILLIGILIVAFAAYLGIQMLSYQEAERVLVSVDGEVFGVYSLHDDQEIKINDTNILVIKGGEADMIHANCPDQICVDQVEISKTGETIVCLPNKVIVEVKGAEAADVDAVTN